ncbi:type II toxin-antitoxin system RelE/ParE family toxin [Halomonas ramblicola]|uniref:type II toxin-antitoxin system RelE/ParE family toxin n=1 Tax=Halomonas ramblicola TaxID=747349 RepID=UPI0025B566C9|nr:type II toxin-antitoxin system RelE/ParE family toxin [Halomonas ramblicola]MDN3520729.1 type II toxin-antitoxin system RelE/ParE family toxin [Halomonas ramblicola]
MWRVVTVERFDQWFMQLGDAEQQAILAGIFKLETLGPHLGRPDVDSLKGALKVRNLKELRIQCKGRPYRILFAFDPVRQAVMLCGGDKTGDKRFYETLIPVAEREFLDHLASLEE